MLPNSPPMNLPKYDLPTMTTPAENSSPAHINSSPIIMPGSNSVTLNNQVKVLKPNGLLGNNAANNNPVTSSGEFLELEDYVSV